MRKIKLWLSALLVFLAPSLALAKVQVVTTTEDLAALTREIGGELVDVSPIAKGYQDPHFVEAKPSYLLKLKKADLFIQVGLELEVGWAPALLISARNSRILPGNDGFLEASRGCDILQKTAGGVDRSQGDVHPLGNPHFWLDPENGRVIARNIEAKLSVLDAAHAKDYEDNLSRFEAKLSEKEKEWDDAASPLKGLRVVTYHNSWPNFVKRFGIEVVNFMEPKPGIPPSPGHVRTLMGQIKAQKVPLILIEPYFDAKLPEKIARETGATMLVFPPSVGAKPEIKTYFDLFDHNLKLLKDALADRG
ncbi:MAG: zinc ABC transporter substrate-binding protein [Elusimicrobia bacterium]|nr:zinc ABC transporter substrate-binding protein [Elusimicrobiota bacterium]